MRIDSLTLCIVLAFFAAINLFWSMAPVSVSNDHIDEELNKAESMPVASRLSLFTDLRVQQEKALSRKPGEPYGWSRLAYLRLATEGNQKAAFDALRMSDLVSPYEAPQLPERAVMWHKFANIESKDELAYQDTLWQKAFRLEDDATWAIAKRDNIVKEVGDALARKDPALADQWKAREASEGIK
jgi:hypothetical protein